MSLSKLSNKLGWAGLIITREETMSKVLYKCAMKNLKNIITSKIMLTKKKSFHKKRKIFIVWEKSNMSQNLFEFNKINICRNLTEKKWNKKNNLNMGETWIQGISNLFSIPK